MDQTYVEAMRLCYEAASQSPDPSTQNAAVLVWGSEVFVETLSVNSFPEGVLNLPERWARPAKYQFVEHAERAAIYAAARLVRQVDRQPEGPACPSPDREGGSAQ